MLLEMALFERDCHAIGAELQIIIDEGSAQPESMIGEINIEYLWPLHRMASHQGHRIPGCEMQEQPCG